MSTLFWIDLPIEGGGGVSSLNGETGAVTLVGGTNVTITPSGSNITIAASGGSPGGSSGDIQYNSSGVLGGAAVTTDGTNLLLNGGKILVPDISSSYSGSALQTGSFNNNSGSDGGVSLTSNVLGFPMLTSFQICPPNYPVNGGTMSINVLDTQGMAGYQSFTVYLVLGSTDVGATACKLQESADNSTWFDITGADFTVGPLVPPSSSDSDHIWEWNINLSGRMRYIRPIVTWGSGSQGAYATLLATLSLTTFQGTDPNAAEQILLSYPASIVDFPMLTSFNLSPPNAQVNGATMPINVIDTLGNQSLTIYLCVGVTDTGATACRLQESADNSNWFDITGADFTDSPYSPPSDTSNVVYEWNINLSGRMRYIRPIVTWGSGSNGAFATLFATLNNTTLQSSDTAASGQALLSYTPSSTLALTSEINFQAGKIGLTLDGGISFVPIGFESGIDLLGNVLNLQAGTIYDNNELLYSAGSWYGDASHLSGFPLEGDLAGNLFLNGYALYVSGGSCLISSDGLGGINFVDSFGGTLNWDTSVAGLTIPSNAWVKQDLFATQLFLSYPYSLFINDSGDTPDPTGTYTLTGASNGLPTYGYDSFVLSFDGTNWNLADGSGNQWQIAGSTLSGQSLAPVSGTPTQNAVVSSFSVGTENYLFGSILNMGSGMGTGGGGFHADSGTYYFGTGATMVDDGHGGVLIDDSENNRLVWNTTGYVAGAFGLQLNGGASLLDTNYNQVEICNVTNAMIVRTNGYIDGLLNITGATCYLGDWNADVNGTSILINDSAQEIYINANNGINFGNSSPTSFMAPVAFAGAIKDITAASSALGEVATGNSSGGLTWATPSAAGLVQNFSADKVLVTNHSAAITSTTLMASPPSTGYYRICWNAVIHTAAGTSSILGGASGFQISYTEGSTSVASMTTPASVTSAANTTTTTISGTILIYALASAAIKYTFGYTSGGSPAMTYNLYATIELVSN